METLSTINNYWAIILFIGAVIASWVRYEYKISGLENSMKETDQRMTDVEKSHDTFREEMKVDIKEIKTTMIFIKEAIADLKGK